MALLALLYLPTLLEAALLLAALLAAGTIAADQALDR